MWLNGSIYHWGMCLLPVARVPMTDMMRGNTLAVIVGNRHQEDLSELEDHERIYFADQSHAGGILEAVEYYDFLNSCKVPEDQ